MQELNLLPEVLKRVPRSEWTTLPGTRVDIDLVAHTAGQWLDDGDPKLALALLEPWFVEDGSFVARRELLFDMLLNLYCDMRKPRKKSQLLRRAALLGDATLRSGAFQRLATMASDKNHFASAWDWFDQAQRADPTRHRYPCPIWK
ncbi:hypothetical protein DFR29_102498 [Tahibacter aquaticus]|uniref:Tetratricopeptide repeat protein n=1 Tax=Tahibacter aquaticus TaxID=520092 RepID=A0A4V3DNB8_9GAMM|nr:hypothetical protein [Tahibacter aquaticus]TDR47836.1 hypothetical protein DFR29_102498 [Tahibacter aquaticus]